MDLDTFEQAEVIVKQMRKQEKDHNEFQEVIAGVNERVMIVTANGNVEITGPTRVRSIYSAIETVFFDEKEVLEEKLKNI